MTCPKQATREREEVPLANVPSPAPRSRRNSDHFERANKTAAGLGQLVSHSGSRRTSEDDLLGPTACTPTQPSPDNRLDAELLGVAYLLNGNTTPVSSVAAAQAPHASFDPHLADADTGAKHACSPRASARWSFPHEGGDALRVSDGHRASNESIAAVLKPIARISGTRGRSNNNNTSGDVGLSRAGGEKKDEPPQLFRTGWSHGGERDIFNIHPKGRRSKSTLGFAVASSSVACERKIADEIMRECRWQSSASISQLAHSRPGCDRSSQSASPVAALQSPPPHGTGPPRVNGRLTDTDTKALPEPGASQLITTQTQTLGGRQNSTMVLADIFWYSQYSVLVSRQWLLILLLYLRP